MAPLGAIFGWQEHGDSWAIRFPNHHLLSYLLKTVSWSAGVFRVNQVKKLNRLWMPFLPFGLCLKDCVGCYACKSIDFVALNVCFDYRFGKCEVLFVRIVARALPFGNVFFYLYAL